MRGWSRACAVAVIGLALAGPASAEPRRHDPSPSGATSPAAASPFHGSAAAIATGRTLFTRYCGNCHTLGATSADSPTDLRRLKRRYGDAMAAVFQLTVLEGRPGVGMPPFKAILSQPTIWRILAYLESVQTGPTP